MTMKDCINTASTKKYVDGRLSSYPTTTDMDTAIDTALADYSTTSEMNSAIADAIADIPTGSGWIKVSYQTFITDYVEFNQYGMGNCKKDTFVFFPYKDNGLEAGFMTGFCPKNTPFNGLYEYTNLLNMSGTNPSTYFLAHGFSRFMIFEDDGNVGIDFSSREDRIDGSLAFTQVDLTERYTIDTADMVIYVNPES
jgi:hypothetical protein